MLNPPLPFPPPRPPFLNWSTWVATSSLPCSCSVCLRLLFSILPLSIPPQSSVCTPYDIIQCRLRPVRATVRALVAMETPSEGDEDTKDIEGEVPIPSPSMEPSPPATPQLDSQALAPAPAPAPAWKIWDLVGSSLVHLLCLLLLFVAYSWIELT